MPANHQLQEPVRLTSLDLLNQGRHNLDNFFARVVNQRTHVLGDLGEFRKKCLDLGLKLRESLLVKIERHETVQVLVDELFGGVDV